MLLYPRRRGSGSGVADNPYSVSAQIDQSERDSEIHHPIEGREIDRQSVFS